MLHSLEGKITVANHLFRTRGILLAARLKALGVDYLVIDKNQNNGDNWALRYDCLRLHTGKSFCETPYIRKFISFSK
jgi:cation diffusion facilitator CzcD-associated flavoprotein CzcO